MFQSALRLSRIAFMRAEVISIDKFAKLSCLNSTNPRFLHLTSSSSKEIRLDHKLKVNVGKKNAMILDGEFSVGIESTGELEDIFPTVDTPNMMFGGILYKELPIINIKVTKNNTIMTLTDHKGTTLTTHSAGVEGYKNAKKGTNIAAQYTAITVANRTIEKGIKNVRVRIQGIGAGRMSSIKGVQMAGLNIVSVTDDTRVSWKPPRPRKQRRV